MQQTVKYPLGEQSFESLRNNGLLYVDKTRFIEQILDAGSGYYFLGRPRRFGKSLFLSTLKCFFQGKRNLFKGLYADTMDWDWETYPVLNVDLNLGKYKGSDDLDILLDNLLQQWERLYDVKTIAGNHAVRFNNVIQAAYEKTGRQVVILIDEYDKPLVNNLHDQAGFDAYRDKLAAFYSNFKSNADYIKLVFLTGVSRFAHLSVFSGLNNITDISFNDRYSDICGITDDELRRYFSYGIKRLSEKIGDSETETISQIKRWYDGYRFSIAGKDIYNPYSLLRLMFDEEFSNYWIQTGQATLLWEILKKNSSDLRSVVNTECSIENLKGLDMENTDIVSLLFQTGYLTIKDVNPRFRRVRLGLPNQEVTEGFLSYLLPLYTSLRNTTADSLIYDFYMDLSDGRAEDFMRRLQAFFADIPYEMQMDREVNFQNAFFILLRLLGLYAQVERRTSAGRIDLFVATDAYLYIVELKLDGSAADALAQINARDYALPFAADSRHVIKIGVNFSTKTRTIQDWIIEQD